MDTVVIKKNNMKLGEDGKVGVDLGGVKERNRA